MEKTLAPLGNVMKLLRLSLAELVACLEVDKTTISKWRTGARKISTRAAYFERLTNFCLARNEQRPGKPLSAFLTGLYGLQDAGPAELKESLKRYLTEDGAFSAAAAQGYPPLPANGTAVFRGMEGRKQALHMLLVAAENSEIPRIVRIMEPEQVALFSRDMAFVQSFMSRLSQLIKKGHKVEFAYSAETDTPEFRIFLRTFELILYSKNIKSSVLHTASVAGLVPAIFSVSGKFTAVGLNTPEENGDLYTTVFLDQFSNEQYNNLYDKVLARYGKPLSATSSGPQKTLFLEKISQTASLPGSVYFYGAFLSVTSMDEALLQSILAANMLSGPEAERCRLFYHLLRRMMEEQPAGTGGYYLDLGMVESALMYDTLIDYELSALVGKPVTKTREQYCAQLRQTAQWLLCNPHIRFSLLAGYRYSGKTACSWMKKDNWCLTFNLLSIAEQHQVIFLDDPDLVAITATLSEQVLVCFPQEFADADYVSHFFTRLSEKEVF